MSRLTSELVSAGLNVKHGEIPDGRNSATMEVWQYAVSYAILEELRRLNTLLHCHNFTGIPHTLQTIALNTRKPKRRRKVKS